MPRMKLVIPEIDSAPKAGQKREITCNYGTTFVKKIYTPVRCLIIVLMPEIVCRL